MDPVRGETAGSTAAAARRQVDTMMPPDVGDGGDLWGAIPQGFRRRFVRGRSRPTSANPVSRSESAISGPYNHRQRHLGSTSSTTTYSGPVGVPAIVRVGFSPDEVASLQPLDQVRQPGQRGDTQLADLQDWAHQATVLSRRLPRVAVRGSGRETAGGSAERGPSWFGSRHSGAGF